MKGRLKVDASRLSLAAVVFAVGGMPAAAAAQSAASSTGAQQVPQQSASPADQAATPDTSPAALDPADAGEIVVTAQRRSERLKDVPLSVTVYSAKELAATGVQSSFNLAAAVPGLQIQATGGHVQPNIRGIGTVQTTAGVESNVATYLDGVYLPNQTLNVFDLEDLENIQVLKGPQGSLYGRNATGGAILINTRRPSRQSNLKLQAGYGSFNEIRLSGYATGPLSDTVSASLSALYRNHDGWGRDVRLNKDIQTYKEFHARGKVLFAPSAATSVLVSVDWGRIVDNETMAIKILNGNTNFPALNPFVPAAPHDYALSFTPFGIRKGGGGSLDVSHDFGGASLRSLTSYRDIYYHNATDNDRISEVDSRFEVFMDQRTISQELTLSSDQSGRFRWLVGAYYIDDRTDSPTYFLPTGVTRTLITDSVIHAKAFAGYFEGTYDLTDRFSVLLGGRYSSETRTIDQVRPTGTPLTGSDSDKASQFTPKASLIYELSPDANVYFTYQKGFKSGAYTATSFLAPATRPEKVDGFEGGLKYASGGTSFNAAAFYYDYRDIQANSRFPSGLAFLLNAAAARIWGFDAEVIVPVSPDFQLRANGAYTNAQYTSFLNPPVLAPVLPNGTGGNVAVTGVDVTGNQLIRTPKFTANITGVYTHAFESGRLGANVSLYYNSGFPWLPEGRVVQKSYALLNGEISWTTHDRYRFTVWGKNLTNTRYGSAVSVTANDAIAYAAPRSIGVSASYSFR